MTFQNSSTRYFSSLIEFISFTRREILSALIFVYFHVFPSRAPWWYYLSHTQMHLHYIHTHARTLTHTHTHARNLIHKYIQHYGLYCTTVWFKKWKKKQLEKKKRFTFKSPSLQNELTIIFTSQPSQLKLSPLSFFTLMNTNFMHPYILQ